MNYNTPDMMRYSILIISISLFLGCSKPDSGSGGNGGGGNGGIIPAPKLVSASPSSVMNGNSVTVSGENFGSDISKFVLKLDNTVITVSTLANTSFSFVVPLTIIASGSRIFDMQVTVNGVVSNIIKLTVNYEARGWYYINKDFPGDLPKTLYMYDNSNKIGFIYGRGLFKGTSNDGVSWGGILPTNVWGEAFHVYNEDEAWIEVGNYDILMYDYEFFPSPNTHYARLDTITTIPGFRNKILTGAFITSTNPRRGYLLTHDGNVFKVNGSFAPSAITLEHQSSFYVNIPNGFANSNYDEINGIDSMNFMIRGKPVIGGVQTPVIMVKRNGVYTDYNLSPVTGSGWPTQIQFAGPNSLFFLTINFDLYKLNVGTNNWEKLTTPKFASFVFLDANTGYASSGFVSGQNYRYIYKTTDGGLTWNTVFSLDLNHYVYAMFTKNGKIWVYGETGFGGNAFVLKYNP